MKRLLTLILLAAGAMHAYAQQRPLIRGRVVDENNKPLPGATVRLKSTNTSVPTDSAGNFQLSPGDQASPVLTISFVGYASADYPVGSRSFVEAHLQPDLRNLSDVVVVGYGTQRKRDVTGATSTVKADEIAKRPLTRVEQALQGTTSGVTVASTSGQPGVGLSVRIRGVNSITGSNEPLYVIDGYIGGSIESLNPNDIESLEILKDASSAAIYGSRGSNGVVLITTKSGREGKPKVDFSSWFTKSEMPKELKLMNAYDFARTVNAQYAASGQPAGFSDERLAELKKTPGTDWQRELHTKPLSQNFQLGVSGGAPNVKYLFSMNYLDQPGLIINQYYRRATLRSNVDVRVNDKIDLKVNVAAVLPKNRNTQYPGDLVDPFTQATEWDPTTPVRDPSTGKYNLNAPFASIQINPVAQAANQAVDVTSTDVTGTATLNYRIIPHLTFTSTNAYELQYSLTQSLFGPETSAGLAGKDNASQNTNRFRSYLNSNFLTYKNTWGDHSLTVTALYEQQNRLNLATGANSNNLASYSLGYYNLGLGKVQFASSGYWQDALQSYMGRVNYSFKDRYLLTAAVRTDGSSHLTEKYSTFPSLALGWSVIKEKFMANSRVFSDFKVRASYGITGNQAVAPYGTIQQILSNTPSVSVPNYYWGGTVAAVATPFGGPVASSLKWERTTAYDAGVDLAFLQNRLTLSVDAYVKQIRDLLYNYQAPFYNSGQQYARNIGSIDNKGLEFAIGGTPVLAHKFKWTTNLTVSFNRNKVVDLGGLDNVTASNIGSPQQNLVILKVGQPLAQFWGYKFEGTWKNSEAAEAAKFGMKPGDAKYQDVNGDDKYTSADLQTIGNGTPKYSFGWINDLNYGDFTLSFMFAGTHGNDIFSQTLAYTWGGLGDARNATTQEALNIWTEKNETNNPTFSKTSANFINSSRFVYDASYIKLKNLAFTYHLPATLLRRVKVRSLDVYVSGQNLFCITHYPGYDPEITNATNALTQGLEMGVIPNPRSYTAGLRLGL